MGTLMLIGAQLVAGPCGYTNHKKMHFYYKILSQGYFHEFMQRLFDNNIYHRLFIA